MAFEAINASLDQVVHRTRAQLAAHRSKFDTDDDFIRRLVQQFVDFAAQSPHGAGSVMMGMSAYRLAIQQIEIDSLRWRIKELQDAVDMRDAGLELMWAIADDASEQERDGRA